MILVAFFPKILCTFGYLVFDIQIVRPNSTIPILYLDFLNTVFVLDETRDILSSIPLCLKEFLMAKPKGTPEGQGVYLTIYPESSPNTDSISLFKSLR